MMKGIAIQQLPVEENNNNNMSNLTCASGEPSFSSISGGGMCPPQSQPAKKKRNLPGNPDPEAEVIALSPRALMATNRFVCEVCKKGFQRDQNLQLHRRGHNLPWKLKQRTNKEVRKKVYVCPETGCAHHDPARALGDLTGIKKHFCRKHGEKKWKCEKCSKKYAVQSDWKAHSKICGTKEYRCDCGTLFSRRDSFITHRAFCDALAEENVIRSETGNYNNNIHIPVQGSSPVTHHLNIHQIQSQFQIKKEPQNSIFLRPEVPAWLASPPPTVDLSTPSSVFQDFQQNQQDFDHHGHHRNPNPNRTLGPTTLPPYHKPPTPSSPHISATALLQEAAAMGAKSIPSPAGVFIRPHQAHVSAGDSCFSTTGFGLNLSSRDEFIHGLASYGNKAAAAATALTGGGGTETGASACGTSKTPSSHPPPLLHDMMMNNPHHHQLSSDTGFEGSTFEDNIAFGEMLNNHQHHHSKKDQENFHMTRDFLGLRPLSDSEIMSLTGLSNCMDSNGCSENQNQAQETWQG